MFFRNTSIQTKLILLAWESAAVALLIACAGFAWQTVDSLCAAKGNQLRHQAESIAWQAGPVLALRDAEAGQRLLTSFWTDSTVEEARLYGKDRELLATWGEQQSLTAPVSTPKGYRYVGFSQVEVVHNVVVGSQRLGTVYVRANTSDLMERLVAFARFSGSVVALAMLVVLLLAIRLRRAIARPLLDLTKVAQRISNNADSTIRIHTDAQAELKTLQDAFNHMLARVQASEAAVRKARFSLEEEVIARTKELSRELRQYQQMAAELETDKQSAKAASQAQTVAQPAVPAPAASEDVPADEGCLAGKRILVVDDAESNRQLLRSILRSAGAEVLVANEGLEAIHVTDQLQPDLILMDVQMPVMDGCSATRELRSNGHTLPIIALLPEYKGPGAETYLQAGFNACLAKPIEATPLLEMVAQQLSETTECATA